MERETPEPIGPEAGSPLTFTFLTSQTAASGYIYITTFAYAVCNSGAAL